VRSSRGCISNSRSGPCSAARRLDWAKAPLRAPLFWISRTCERNSPPLVPRRPAALAQSASVWRRGQAGTSALV